ncbi:hypothetical protein SERLADRAFT_347359 [Serpula lacrymans var. lacrymans S7.9]|uniref:NADAR domain-containing protein n=1 Tax=Serpula lacrymans var. lacrymans (strain S7.9) TaxID=578457 RepID=F8NNH7_SERL9|nr:uncharacterized protein SERLADRAFT_347359 [Serpula lacrymans var. lacrymans S7.9]EGO28034.1 hypothetical protein SERLADRAFT_347359 [Serpula lacrymans var. lacrymans S7.9]
MHTPRVRPGRAPTPGPSILSPSAGTSATQQLTAIKFDHRNELRGFLNHSTHRVMYEQKIYPTALHLLEALKFKHQHPDLAERIRKCKDVNEVYTLSAGMQEHVRSDWGNVFLKVTEEVLYHKFKQHPDLRSLLLNTGIADLVYADAHTYWGEGPLGDGANELGKALVRVRDKLRAEGYGI